MEMHPETLPEDRLGNPKRSAERVVFQILKCDEASGVALYEWSAPAPGCEEADFSIWTPRARVAMQVKGGHIVQEGMEWFLETAHGLVKVNSPLNQTIDASIALKSCIKVETGFSVLITNVLVFPDMEKDQAIDEWARRKGVYCIWGTDNLLADLDEIVALEEVRHPPLPYHIRNEVAAVTNGRILLDPRPPQRKDRLTNPAKQAAPLAAVGNSNAASLELGASTINISHVENLFLQTVVPEADERAT